MPGARGSGEVPRSRARPESPPSRLQAYGLAGVVLVAGLSPLVRGKDDFPLSTFPMFSSRRPEVALVARATALDGGGLRFALSPELVANDEPMQAVATLRRTFERGPEASRALCEEIAARVAVAGGALRDAEHVELDRAELPVLGFFAGDTEPRSVRLEARCPIVRGTRAPKSSP